MKKPTPRKQASAARKNSTQTALANLEKSARKGDPKAKARLEKIYKLLHPGRSGRPEGSTTKHTVKGADSFENLLCARWGENWDTDGGCWAHQAWINQHPSPGTLKLRAAAQRTTPAALLAEIKREPMNEAIVAKISDAIDRRDFRFFVDMALTLQRLNDDGTINMHDPQAVALIFYVESERRWKPERRFTQSELLGEEVGWGKREDGSTLRPSESHLRRLITKFEIPMQRGPAPAK